MKSRKEILKWILLCATIDFIVIGLFTASFGQIGNPTSSTPIYLQNGNINATGNIITTGWINATQGITSISLPYTYTITAQNATSYIAQDIHGNTTYTNTTGEGILTSVLNNNDTNVLIKTGFYNDTNEVDITNVHNLKVVGESWNARISNFYPSNHWTLNFIGCDNIEVENLNLSDTSRHVQGTFTDEYGQIKLQATNNSLIQHNFIQWAYGYGVRVRANESNLAQECFYDTVWDNTFVDCSHSSIVVHGGEHIDIEYNNCSKVFGANNGGAGRTDAQENICLNSEQTGGVTDNASYCTISHNIIRGGGIGISINIYTNPSYMSTAFNTISYNDIGNIGNSSTKGPDMYLQGDNLDVGPDNIVQTVIGQYISSNIYVDSNPASASGIPMRGLNIHDNTLINQVHWGISSATSVILNETQIENNNIYSADGESVVFQNSSNNGIIMTGNTINQVYAINGVNNHIYGNNGAGLETADLKGPAYMMLYDGSYYYYAQNGTTGTMDVQTSNSTQAFQYAINSSADGSTIYVEAGDFLNHGQITIQNRENLTIQGENWGAVIEETQSASDVFEINCSTGIVFKDLTIKQHTAHVQSVSYTDEAGQIYFNACNDSLVDHCQLLSPYGYGVRIRCLESGSGTDLAPYTLCYRITVQNCLIENASHCTIQISGGWFCQILHNYFYKIYGANNGGSQRTDAQESFVITAENSTGTVVSSMYNVVDHNTFVGGQCAINIVTFTTDTSDFYDGFNTITNNFITGMDNSSGTQADIFWEGSYETFEYNTVIRLYNEDNGGALIYFQVGGTNDNPLVGNVICWNTLIDNATGYVISAQNKAELNCTLVIGNTCYCNTADYTGAWTNTTSDYNSIQLNISNKPWYNAGNSHGNCTNNIVDTGMSLPPIPTIPDPP